MKILSKERLTEIKVLVGELISAHASEIQFRNGISMVQHRKEWPTGCSACEAIAKAEGTEGRS